MAIASISDGQSDRKPVSSELLNIILAKVQKGYKSLLKKNQISISCKNAYLHIMSFITTKFHEILLRGFSGVALTKCFRSIFYFGQISNFKKGVIPIRKLNQNSCGYAYQHIMSFITTKFLEILLSGFRGVVLTNRFSCIFKFD